MSVVLKAGGPVRFGRRWDTGGNHLTPDPSRPGWSLPNKWVPAGERIGPYWLENSSHAMVGATPGSLRIDRGRLAFDQPETEARVVLFAAIPDESMAELGITVGGSGGVGVNRISFFRGGRWMNLDDHTIYSLLTGKYVNLWLGIFSQVDEPDPIDEVTLAAIIDQRIEAALDLRFCTSF